MIQEEHTKFPDFFFYVAMNFFMPFWFWKYIPWLCFFRTSGPQMLKIYSKANYPITGL